MITSVSSTATTTRPRIAGARFHTLYFLAVLWLIVGGYCDSWAHFNIPRLETFFTIWHAVLYSGLLVVLLVTGGTVLLNRLRGYSWREAIPDGYDWALVGALGFFVAGIGDMIWHTLFGIEKNIDGQFSPTHLAIMVCYGFVSIAPLRALGRASQAPSRWLLPLCTILFLGFFHLLVMPVHPYNFYYPTDTLASQTTEQILAVVSYLFYGAVLSVFTQYVIGRWHVPFGFFTALYTVTAVAVSIMQAHFLMIGVAAVAGLITDGLYWRLQPRVGAPETFRLFVFLAAVTYYLAYFLCLQFVYGVVWTIHLSLGTIVTSGILAWLLSYLVIPDAERFAPTSAGEAGKRRGAQTEGEEVP